MGTQKIACNRLKTYRMIFFAGDDKDEMFHFFEKTFLLAKISIDITFKIFLLILRNVEVNYNDLEFKWRLYITAKALPIIRWVKLIEKKSLQ